MVQLVCQYLAAILPFCIRDVAVPFVAATGAAVGTGVYLNKVVAKVTV